jgi:plastocyanin
MKKICTKLFSNYEARTLTLIALTTALVLAAWSAPPTGRAENLAQLVQVTSAAEPVSTGTEIKIDNFVFQPAEMTIKAGTQVTWTNKDDIPHTVDSTEGKFKSAALDTDEKFQFRFTEPGEYPFFCRMHPKMTGKIVVQP